MKSNWTPRSSLETWKLRLDLVQRTRSFFMSRKALEVETPTLSRAMGTDPHIDYFETRSIVDGQQQQSELPLYLCTSPEFHMKRLLAAGWGDVWQLCKAYRSGEVGPRHNPEFSILEWYRVGWDWMQLMEEVVTLCVTLSQGHQTPGALKARKPARLITWRDAYRKHCGFDPLFAPVYSMAATAQHLGVPPLNGATREEWLDYLMALQIEPNLGADGPEFLISYPPHHAALAMIENDAAGLPWARRFELYLDGVELCNGYQELCDPQEQAKRFEADLRLREKLGKRIPPIDTEFLAALQNGLPACSGIALGFDRLAMLILGEGSLEDVLTFPVTRA